jgi:hypothetical protein
LVLSGLLPAGLLAKADSVLMVASGTPQGTVVWMANVHRVDHKASGIDQEPFGIVFHGDTPSGIGNCYPFSGLPGTTAGPISDLTIPSQHDAFGELVNQLNGSLTSGG